MIDPERWRRLEDLFEAAVARPPGERAEYLRRHCDDEAMRREVAEMLEADGRESWIGASVREALGAGADAPHPDARDASLDDSLDDEPIPERVGPYRVVGVLGRGGMSTVLLGERDDDAYSLRVAVKLVRRGLDTADLLRRLRQERQILARLDHPHIARLLDGGSTDDGRPFVVMERVDGLPIDEACRRRSLDLTARLELFLSVCDAMSYAHRNLVIHRDVKPSNVLVTSDGVPKLLDFGIAKLLRPEQHAPRDAAVTVPGLRLLTPGYASPEQLRGEALSTATDVYSLGVVLFELLTGERLYDPPLVGAPRPPTERASERVRRRAADPSREPAPVPVHRLRGDLDTIVATALHEEPERRYPSVERLADDVRRHLDDLPIRARRDALGYRIGKFVRRHRAAVAGAVLFAVVLLGATLVTTRQARIADEQRMRAEGQSARAETVTEFLVDLFEVSDPGEARGSTITAREILDRGANRLVDGLDAQPAAQATLADTMGRVYQNLGLYDQAAALFTAAHEQRLALLGDEHPDVATSLNHLGEALFHQGRYEPAVTHVERALEIRRRTLGDDDPATLESVDNLAALRFTLGDLDAAERLFRRNLERRRRILGPEHEDVAATLDNLAAVLTRRGETAEAEALVRQALALRTRLLGADHPDVAQTTADLAVLLHVSGRPDEAEPLYRRALEIERRVLGVEHPRVAQTSVNLAALLRDRRSDAETDTSAETEAETEAEGLLRNAVEVQRRHLGDDHVQLAHPLIHLGDLLRLRGRSVRETIQGDFREADALYREALALRRRWLPAGHPDLTPPIEGLARLELARAEAGDPAAAERALELALEVEALRREALRAGHPDLRAAERLVERCRRVALETATSTAAEPAVRQPS